MNFTAVDVETANPDIASICQIGIARFENGSLASTWQQLINPNDWFDVVNISIHQITEDAVREQPTFAQLYPEILSRLAGQVVVSHTMFDRSAIAAAVEQAGLPPIECRWLDSARVARRAWEECAQSGYGLKKMARKLGIKFEHHTAAEDARAAGEIVLQAIAHTCVSLEEWLVRSRRHHVLPEIGREGNPDGPLSGEEVVFTGTLSIPRRQAAELAATAGCVVAESVKKTTTLLVVGDQDIRYLAGQEKSSKHRKAEQLISAGQAIRILRETDFRRMLDLEPEEVPEA